MDSFAAQSTQSLGETKGTERGMDGGTVQGPAFCLLLLWRHTVTVPVLYCAVLFEAEVGQLGPFGIDLSVPYFINYYFSLEQSCFFSFTCSIAFIS